MSRFSPITRRQLVASSVVGSAAVLTVGHLAQAGQSPRLQLTPLAQDGGGSVPMYRGNAARTGEMPGPGPDPQNGIEVIWQFRAPDYESTDEGIVDTLVLANEVVYACSDFGVLYALSAMDGSELWHFNADSSISNPTVVDGVVYVGSEEGVLYAIGATDGSELWRFTGTDSDIGFPVVVAGIVYAVSIRGGVLFALNADSGVEIWQYRATSDWLGAPAVANGMVFSTSGSDSEGGTLHSLDAIDGSERWTFKFSHGGSFVSAIVGNVAYFGSSQERATLFALNTEDGSELWRYVLESETEDRFGDVAVTEGVVYAPTNNGVLYALDAADGTEVWRTSSFDTYIDYPVVADGVVYIGESDNFLALDTGDGAELWKFSTGDGDQYQGYGGDWLGAVVANETIFIVGGATVVAIGARIPTLSAGGTARITEKTLLRGGPASTAVERAQLENETVIAITGESEMSGDVEWWPVTVNDTGDQGWVEASKLEPLSSGPEPPGTP